MQNTYTLITGASSGLGGTTAKLLSKARNLILHGRDLERLESVAQECMQHGNTILIFPYDLLNVQTLASDLKSFLLENNLRVDSFIHYAGMTDLLPVNKTKYTIGLQVMNVNYFSAVEIISTLLKRKINEKFLQSVVLITSTTVQVGIKYQPHYVASKGAIEGLLIALTLELAPQVRVNCIAPGSFKTRMTETLFSEPSQGLQSYALLAPGTMDDVANVAQFLISNESRFITGERITVDGGERLKRIG